MKRVKPAPTSPSGLAIVTGASSGIGLEVARGLAIGGARLLLPVRDHERGESAISSIRESAPDADLALADLDLASADSVSALVAQLRERAEPIGLLILNAGVVMLGERIPQITADGFELTFQSNYLGHVELTLGILPLLRAGAARVVVQCSLAAARARLDGDKLRSADSFRAFRAYQQSKIALGMFGLELDRRSRASEWGITVQLCHPGITPGSKIAPAVRGMFPDAVVRLAAAHVGNTPERAAQTALRAAFSDAASPRLYAPAGHFGIAGMPAEQDPFASLTDEAKASELWQQTMTLLDGRLAF